MIRSLLAKLAKRSTSIQIQVALATIYGLISIFGYGRTAIIVYKVAKAAQKPKVKKNGNSAL